jgi:hypothetical protein
MHEFKAELNDYLRLAVGNNEVLVGGQVKRIKDLADIIKFNERFPSPEGYDQAVLIQSQETDGIKNKTYIAERDKNKLGAQLYANYIFEKYSVDAIMIPTANSTSIPAISGYPHITVRRHLKNSNSTINISTSN